MKSQNRKIIFGADAADLDTAESKAENPAALLSSKKLWNHFPTVGIGAAEGGLGAFTPLLNPLPLDMALPLVLVQNLDLRYENARKQSLRNTMAAAGRQARHAGGVRPRISK